MSAPIPEDLKQLYGQCLQAIQRGDHDMRPNVIKPLIERIANMEAENARLSAPVSDEEFEEHGQSEGNSAHPTQLFYREEIDALIAARKNCLNDSNTEKANDETAKEDHE